MLPSAADISPTRECEREGQERPARAAVQTQRAAGQRRLAALVTQPIESWGSQGGAGPRDEGREATEPQAPGRGWAQETDYVGQVLGGWFTPQICPSLGEASHSCECGCFTLFLACLLFDNRILFIKREISSPQDARLASEEPGFLGERSSLWVKEQH